MRVSSPIPVTVRLTRRYDLICRYVKAKESSPFGQFWKNIHEDYNRKRDLKEHLEAKLKSLIPVSKYHVRADSPQKVLNELKGHTITQYRRELEHFHGFGLEFKHGLQMSNGRTAWFLSTDQDICVGEKKRNIDGLGDIADQNNELKPEVKMVPCWKAHKRECCSYRPIEIWQSPYFDDFESGFHEGPTQANPKTLIGRQFVSLYGLGIEEDRHHLFSEIGSAGFKLDDGTVLFAFDGEQSIGVIALE